jgi:hypothetical protein
MMHWTVDGSYVYYIAQQVDERIEIGRIENNSALAFNLFAP